MKWKVYWILSTSLIYVGNLLSNTMNIWKKWLSASNIKQMIYDIITVSVQFILNRKKLLMQLLWPRGLKHSKEMCYHGYLCFTFILHVCQFAFLILMGDKIWRFDINRSLYQINMTHAANMLRWIIFHLLKGKQVNKSAWSAWSGHSWSKAARMLACTL